MHVYMAHCHRIMIRLPSRSWPTSFANPTHRMLNTSCYRCVDAVDSVHGSSQHKEFMKHTTLRDGITYVRPTSYTIVKHMQGNACTEVSNFWLQCGYTYIYIYIYIYWGGWIKAMYVRMCSTICSFTRSWLPVESMHSCDYI